MMPNYTKLVIANFATFVGLGFSKWNYDYYTKIKHSKYTEQIQKDYIEYMNGVGHL